MLWGSGRALSRVRSRTATDLRTFQIGNSERLLQFGGELSLSVLLIYFSLTHFACGRIFKFRDALSRKAIAVFYFWRRECNFESSLINPGVSEAVN